MLLLAGVCGSAGVIAAPPKTAPVAKAAKKAPLSEAADMAAWAETEALIEWRVARLAAACNEVAESTNSADARREVLRLKAAYATSNYAILSSRNPLVQALDLTAMAALNHEVWIEEGRAKAEFGEDAKPLIAALEDVRKRTRAHALTQMSAREFEGVESMVRAWRKAHPGPVVVEFIRFEAFAEEIAASMGAPPNLGGLFGRITGGAHSVELLGERALSLTSRMPRLAEWHAEAAAANVLAQQDLELALKSIGQLGELQRVVPEQVKMLDARLAGIPAELAGAVAEEPELKAALAQLKSMEGSLQALERSVASLSLQLGQINASAHPDALRQFSGETLGVLSSHGRSLILLATACAAGLLILNAWLRRWGKK
jgi:hypothetical protein